MAAISVRILANNTPALPHKKVTIAGFGGGEVFTFPVLRDSGFDSVGGRWELFDRPGKRPLTVWGGTKAVRANLEVVVQGASLAESIEYRLLLLKGIAQSNSPVTVALGKMSTWARLGQWVVDEMTVDVEARVQGTNEIARAIVGLELIAAMTPKMLRDTPLNL